MLRPALFLASALLAGSLAAQPDAGPPPALNGHLEGRTYVSPTGTFRIAIPVLPELGGFINDTPNVVTFQDRFNVHASIGVFAQDATQRWELSTRGVKDYLIYFFDTFVMPDFRRLFPGSQVQSAEFLPGFMGGAYITYTLLPGGSMFDDRRALLRQDEAPPVAKRGNLMIVRNGVIFVVSTELAERVIERSSYKKTAEEEDDILRQRLVDLAKKMEFTRPLTSP
jgi:hypothetical protein